MTLHMHIMAPNRRHDLYAYSEVGSICVSTNLTARRVLTHQAGAVSDVSDCFSTTALHLSFQNHFQRLNAILI